MFRIIFTFFFLMAVFVSGSMAQDSSGTAGLGDYVELTYVFSFGVPGFTPGAFQETQGIALGPDGSIYVADRAQNRISIFSQYGEFLGLFEPAEIRGSGTAEGPYDIAFDSEGNLYVSDIGREIVTVFDPDGEVLRVLEAVAYSISFDADGNMYLTSPLSITVFNAAGEQINSFSFYDEEKRRLTYDYAIDEDGNQYVSWIEPILENNNQIGAIGHLGVFDSSGNLLRDTVLGAPEPDAATYDERFKPAASLVVGPDNFVYLQGKGLHVIDDNGTILRSISGAWGLWEFDSIMIGDFIYLTAGDHVEVYSVNPDIPFWEGTLNGNARFRGGPGTSFDVVGTLSEGARILIFGTDDTGEWLQTQLDGAEAWVAGFLVNR